MGTVGLSSEVKWLRHDDDDHSPLSGAEVREWGYTATPPYAFRARGKIYHCTFQTEINIQTCAKGTSKFLNGFRFFSFINETSSWA